MQNVQGSPARLPIAYQGTTVRNVTPSAQMSQQVVNNPQVQGQAMLNQPGTSRQGMAGSSTGSKCILAFFRGQHYRVFVSMMCNSAFLL